jgi:hypothetical protein
VWLVPQRLTKFSHLPVNSIVNSWHRFGSSHPCLTTYFCSDTSNTNRLPHSQHLSRIGSYTSRLARSNSTLYAMQAPRFLYYDSTALSIRSEKQPLVQAKCMNVSQVWRLSTVHRSTRIACRTFAFVANPTKIRSVPVKYDTSQACVMDDIGRQNRTSCGSSSRLP